MIIRATKQLCRLLSPLSFYATNSRSILASMNQMLIQYDNDTITMLPAWPATWDVRFRVNAPGNAIREGVIQDGKMKKQRPCGKNSLPDLANECGKHDGWFVRNLRSTP